MNRLLPVEGTGGLTHWLFGGGLYMAVRATPAAEGRDEVQAFCGRKEREKNMLNIKIRFVMQG